MVLTFYTILWIQKIVSSEFLCNKMDELEKVKTTKHHSGNRHTAKNPLCDQEFKKETDASCSTFDSTHKYTKTNRTLEYTSHLRFRNRGMFTLPKNGDLDDSKFTCKNYDQDFPPIVATGLTREQSVEANKVLPNPKESEDINKRRFKSPHVINQPKPLCSQASIEKDVIFCNNRRIWDRKGLECIPDYNLPSLDDKEFFYNLHMRSLRNQYILLKKTLKQGEKAYEEFVNEFKYRSSAIKEEHKEVAKKSNYYGLDTFSDDENDEYMKSKKIRESRLP